MKAALPRWAVVVGSAISLVAMSNAASAEGWRVVDKVGTVTTGAEGFQKSSVSRDAELAADSWVETGMDGRAVLARGRETIVLAPGSRLQLPDEEKNGNTQVLQTLGSAFYQIGKQAKPHFQVDAPALAAVVKGTAFTVTVDGNQSSVAVSEGLVQVVTTDGTADEYVRPGFVASVTHGTSMISVERGTAPGTDETGKPTAEPKKDKTANTVTIPATIGEMTLDIKTASEGLAYGDVTIATTTTVAALTDAVDGKGKDEGKDNNGNGNGNGGNSVPIIGGVIAAIEVEAGGRTVSTGAQTPGIVPTLIPDLGDVGVELPEGGNGNGNANGHDKPNGNGKGLGKLK